MTVDKTKKCSIEGCDNPIANGRGWCGTHYSRWRRNGSVDAARPYHFSQEESFKAYTRQAESGCILWTASTNNQGYGRVTSGKKWVAAHRYAWEREFGPIPDGLCVLHKCDTPACVNVDHLLLGTMQDNTDDMVSKDRKPVGSQVRTAKLSEEEARSILDDDRPQYTIASVYGISQSLVSRIKSGKSWKHVNHSHEEGSISV